MQELLVSGYSVHWPIFMVEGLTPLPFHLVYTCINFMYVLYICPCCHEGYKYCKLEERYHSLCHLELGVLTIEVALRAGNGTQANNS